MPRIILMTNLLIVFVWVQWLLEVSSRYLTLTLFFTTLSLLGRIKGGFKWCHENSFFGT